MTPPFQLAWTTVPDGASRRAVAWDLLRKHLPPEARLTQACPRCGGAHGPVSARGVPRRVSVTYAAGMAVVAVADATVVESLGVDAEPERDEVRDAAGLRGVLVGDPSVRDWTRVEAAVKADGRGLRVDPAAVRVVETGAGCWRADVPGGGTFTGWDANGPEGLIVSVAARIRADGAERCGPARP